MGSAACKVSSGSWQSLVRMRALSHVVGTLRTHQCRILLRTTCDVKMFLGWGRKDARRARSDA
eukprot:7339237-Pyramimonas_sp.AAC.1